MCVFICVRSVSETMCVYITFFSHSVLPLNRIAYSTAFIFNYFVVVESNTSLLKGSVLLL